MIRKIGFGLLWVFVLVYAFFLAPPEQAGTFDLIKNLSTGQWDGINPLIVALFNIMGVWPGIYSALLFSDGRGQKVPAWPFLTLSFGVGAFGLIPYLALRNPNPIFSGQKDAFLKFWDARGTGIVLAVIAIALLFYGLRNGNWTDFAYQWQTSRFIHVMSWDFCLLALLFPTVLRDDMERRGLHDLRLFAAIALLPLIGPLLYLCFRPGLKEDDSSVAAKPAS